MRTFKFSKLVRDKVLETMLANPDQKPNYKTLDQEAFTKELLKKIIEESNELVDSNPKDVLNELADIYEIIIYILKMNDATLEDLIKLVEKKQESAGGFDKKSYIESVTVDDDSEWVKHYQQQSDKYPEIND